MRRREIFPHEVFVPHPYALVDPPGYDPQGKWSLFAAHRLGILGRSEFAALSRDRGLQLVTSGEQTVVDFESAKRRRG